MGNAEDTYFTSVVDDFKVEYSAWNVWPNPEINPDSLYKFLSVNVGLTPDLVQHNRKTDSLQDWLGDCGGLMDALVYIGYLMATPYQLFALRSKLA